MVNYANGKVYKIEPICDHEEGEIYIGSTAEEYLSDRMKTHISGYSRWLNGTPQLTKSYEIFDKYGLENCTIVLLENVQACSRDELELREAYYIQNVKCLNKNIPGRQIQLGKVAYNKLYRMENLAYLQNQSKEYYAKNKNTVIERATKFNRENKEKRAITCKRYYLKNKDKIHKKISCECGGCCTESSKSRHSKTNQHQNFLNQQIQYDYTWEDGTPATLQDYIDTH